MKGILLLGKDETIEGRAKKNRTALQNGVTPALPFAKTLITVPGTRVPWELLPAAWSFLEKWDAAVPLWRYDVTAASVGTAAEREATQAVIRDLRVLMHSTELLFVRRNEAGEALLAAWLEEMAAGSDKRLAFLRAVYRVKPRLCVLPVSWLVDAQEVASRRPKPVIIARPPAPPARAGRKLVQVEVSPGRFVKVHAGDEERVRAQFARQLARPGRGGRHR